eukprot:3772858-Rhodomonas_salina.1
MMLVAGLKVGCEAKGTVEDTAEQLRVCGPQASLREPELDPRSVRVLQVESTSRLVPMHRPTRMLCT